jgi:hypothetical protein
MDRRSFVIGTAASATALATGPAFAQDAFPSHAITVINAFPPGGINDIITRPFAAAMEPIVKQPVVVETKAGAGGQVGAQVAAHAKPDGYTILSHNNGISGYAEVDKLFGRQPKTTRADFIPLARLVADPVLVLVNDKQPAKTLKEFIEAAKKAPESIVYSSGGLYGATHLPVALLEKATGISKMRHLPTNGGGPAITALLGNNAQMSTRAGLVRGHAFESAAGCADAQGARLRRRILSLGRHLRAEGHPCQYRRDAEQRHRKGGALRRVHERGCQSQSRLELPRRQGIRGVLGSRRQAFRRSGAAHRQAGITGMILRADHVAGAAFVAFGAAIIALSGDLPVGRLSMPGSGFLPMIVAVLTMIFGLALILRGRESEPFAALDWADGKHALMVTGFTAAATALYEHLGFIVTMLLMMIGLLLVIERRNAVRVGIYSVAVVLVTYVCFVYGLKTPLPEYSF